MKEVVLNGTIVSIVLLLYSFYYGHYILKFLKMRHYICRSIVYGFTFLVALFEILALVCIKVKTNFNILFYLYVILVTVTLIILISLFIMKKEYKRYLKDFNIRKYLFISLIATVIVVGFQVFQSTYKNHTDADDGYFVTISNIAVEKNEINLDGVRVYNGGDYDIQSVRSESFSWELLIAVISKGFRIHPAVLCHSVLPGLLILLCYLAALEVGRKLIFNRKKLYLFLFFWGILNIFGGYTNYSSGCFLLLRVWQGKAMVVNFVFLMLMANCINIYKNKDNIGTFIFNAVIVLAGMAFSTVGVFLMPIMYLIIGIPYLFERIIKKDYSRIVIVLKNVVITMIPIILYDIYMFISVSNSSAGAAYMQKPASKWGDVFQLAMMNGSYFVIFLIGLIYLYVKKRKSTKSLLFIGMTIGLFITFLNPFLTKVIAQRITGVDVYWRLYWILPIYFTIAYMFSDLIYREQNISGIVTMFVCVLIIKYAGTYMYDNNLYFSTHTNKYKIPDEVIQVCNYIMEEGKDVTCLFPEDLSYYPRQYSSYINVIEARDMRFDLSIIPNTKYSYSLLYNEVYEKGDLDSDEIKELLVKLQVEYIYTNKMIKTNNYEMVKIVGESGYLYRAIN